VFSVERTDAPRRGLLFHRAVCCKEVEMSPRKPK
jgi:hypothetical protein